MPTLFQNRISSQLTQILRLYVMLVTALVLGITLAGAYFYEHSRLNHERSLVTTKLGAEVSNAASDLQSLASATVLWTGLTDSQGREVYLEPLLLRFNRAKVRQLVVLDYRGRVFLAPPSFSAQQAQGVADDSGVNAAVQQGADGFSQRVLPDGHIEILLVHRVMSPVAATPVGFIVAVVDVTRTIASLGLEPDLKVSIALGRLPLLPEPASAHMLSSRGSVRIEGGESEQSLTVWIGRPLLGMLGLAALATLVAVTLGLITVSRVRQWARRFSEGITGRLDRLVLDSQRILGGEAGVPADIDAPDPAQDELSDVTRALTTMLQRQKQTTDELRATSLVFSTAAEGILVTDSHGLIVDVNPALLSMTGYSRDELIGRLAGTLYNSHSEDGTGRQIAQAIDEEGRWSGETTFLARSGRTIPASVSISRIRGERGEAAGHVAVITDVTRLKEAERRLRDLAYRDALTGLPNFRHMSEQAREWIVAARTRARPMAALFIDLDRLKALNDNYGHEIGDVMIRAVSSTLSLSLPPGHLLCRRSGDEFIALIDLPDESTFLDLQERLGRINPIEIDTDAGRLAATITVGGCRFPSDASDWSAIQICADVALNAAKHRQRGSIAWYDASMGSKLYRHRQIQSKLARAIEEGQIEVHYQPEVDLRSGRLIGFEALARWTDSQLGAVRPVEFISVAEDAQLIAPLTLAVTQTVLRDKAALQARFPGAVVAFNAAPQAFRDQRLLRLLTNAAECDPDCLDGLEIELTESQIADSDGQLLAQLQAVAGLGVQLVIDDFGTGYSSLGRLTQFPIRRLKIDRSFVAGLDQQTQQRIARLVISLAAGLGLQVTAEGVETQAQREMLLEMGCLRGQGWLFAKAMPLPQALALAPQFQAAPQQEPVA